MQTSGWKDRYWAIGLTHQQLKLGTPQDDALGARSDEWSDDFPEPLPRVFTAHTESQLIKDRIVHGYAIQRLWNDYLDIVRRNTIEIERFLSS